MKHFALLLLLIQSAETLNNAINKALNQPVGVSISSLPPNSLVIPWSNGTVLPVTLVNPTSSTTAGIIRPFPVQEELNAGATLPYLLERFPVVIQSAYGPLQVMVPPKSPIAAHYSYQNGTLHLLNP